MDVGTPDLGSATFGSVVVAAAPDRIMLEGGLKLDYEHWRFEVEETGVTGGGGVNLVARTRRSPSPARAARSWPRGR